MNNAKKTFDLQQGDLIKMLFRYRYVNDRGKQPFRLTLTLLVKSVVTINLFAYGSFMEDVLAYILSPMKAYQTKEMLWLPYRLLNRRTGSIIFTYLDRIYGHIDIEDSAVDHQRSIAKIQLIFNETSKSTQFSLKGVSPSLSKKVTDNDLSSGVDNDLGFLHTEINIEKSSILLEHQRKTGRHRYIKPVLATIL